MSKKITEMPSKTAVAVSDILTIVDVADNNANKKVVKTALFQRKINASATTPVAALSGYLDRLVVYDNPLTSLTIDGEPYTNYTLETEFQFITDSTFTFTAAGLVGKWIGGAPTFEPNKSYVIAIKNGLASWGEVS